jgi:4-hydroxy-2-oxoheptanedioate aldolase
MKSASILKQKIKGDKPVLGALASFHFWPGMVEIAMNAGLDYLMIDLEHLTHNAEMVAEACAIGRRADFAIIIRPAAAEFTLMRLAMDLGPCGLLIPYVENIETMNEVRQAVYMKPRGRRRPGGLGNAWVNDYNYASWKTQVEDDLIIIPQIESKVGLENAEAIARDPVTTAMAIGPYDMSADLGVCWQPDHPLLVGAFERIRQAGRAAGKNMWVIGDGSALMRRGFNFICLAEITMLIESGLKTLVQQTNHGATASATTSTDKPLP